MIFIWDCIGAFRICFGETVIGDGTVSSVVVFTVVFIPHPSLLILVFALVLWMIIAQISLLFYTWSCSKGYFYIYSTILYWFICLWSTTPEWMHCRVCISITGLIAPSRAQDGHLESTVMSPSPFGQHTRQVHLHLRTRLQAGSRGDAIPCPLRRRAESDGLHQTTKRLGHSNKLTDPCLESRCPKMYVLDNWMRRVWADEWWPTDGGPDVAWLSRPKCVNLSNLGLCFHLWANLSFRASLGTWHQSLSRLKLSWNQLPGSAARGWPLLVMAATQEHGGGLQLWGRLKKETFWA